MRKMGNVRRPRLSALAIAVQAALGLPVAWALPQGATVVHGQVGIAQPVPGQMQVTAGDGAIINWQRFSIGPGELARFIQPSAQSAVLNRVTGGEVSQILGQLQANGRVFLINPQGIVVGSGARIDTNSFVASTLDITDADFLAGRLRFMAGATAGGIRNEGLITAAPGGKVALIAPDIVNSGIIHAPDGQILLAAGRRIEIASTEDAAVRFEVQAPTDSVLNLGRLLAENGAVRAFAATLRNAGEVRADRLVQGADGRIELVASGELTLAAGSVVSAAGQGSAAGGSVRVESLTGTTRVTGRIDTTGSIGGRVQVLGDRVALEAGTVIDASGSAGGGTVLVGGDYQGANAAVRNANRVNVAEGAVLRADAVQQGDGGRVIVWADENTRFAGSISARGGAQGGNGGFAEVSGRQNLQFTGNADLQAPHGAIGTLLLDPQDIVVAIGSGLLPTVTDEFADFVPNVVTIDPGKLNAIGANVTLQASRNIFIKDRISLATAGAGVTVLAGGASATGGGIVLEDQGATRPGGIFTNGGSVVLRGSSVTGPGVIRTAGGAVDIQTTGDLNYTSAIDSGGGAVNLASTSGAVNGPDVSSGPGTIGVRAAAGIHGGRYATSGTATFATTEGDIALDAVIAGTATLQAPGSIDANVQASDRVNAQSTGSYVQLGNLGGSLLRLGTVRAAEGIYLHTTAGLSQASGGSLDTPDLRVWTNYSFAGAGTSAAPLQLVSSGRPMRVQFGQLKAPVHLQFGGDTVVREVSLDGSVAALAGSTLSGSSNLGAWSFGTTGAGLRFSASASSGFSGLLSLQVTDGALGVDSLDLQGGGAASFQAAGAVSLGNIVTTRTSGYGLQVLAQQCTVGDATCTASSPITVGSINAGTGWVRLQTTDNGDVRVTEGLSAGSVEIYAGRFDTTYLGASPWSLGHPTTNQVNLAAVNATGNVNITLAGHGSLTIGRLAARAGVSLSAGHNGSYNVPDGSGYLQRRTDNTIAVTNADPVGASGSFTIQNQGAGDLTLNGDVSRTSGTVTLSTAAGNVQANGRLATGSQVQVSAQGGTADLREVVAGSSINIASGGDLRFDRLASTGSSVTVSSATGSVATHADTPQADIEAAGNVSVSAQDGTHGRIGALDIRAGTNGTVTLAAGGDIGSASRAVRVDTSGTLNLTTGGQFHVDATDLVGATGERTLSAIQLTASAAGMGAGGTSSLRTGGLDVSATSDGSRIDLGALESAQALQEFSFTAQGSNLALGNVALTGTGARNLRLTADGALAQQPGAGVIAGNVALRGSSVQVGNVTANATTTNTGVDLTATSGDVQAGNLTGRQVTVAGGNLTLGSVASTGNYRYYSFSERLSLTAAGNISTSGNVTSATSASLQAVGEVVIGGGTGTVAGGTQNSYGADTVQVNAGQLRAGNVSAHTVDLSAAQQATVGAVNATGNLAFRGGDLTAASLTAGGTVQFTGGALQSAGAIQGANVSFDGTTLAAASVQAGGRLDITTSGAFDAGTMRLSADNANISAGGNITIGSGAPLAARQVSLTTREGSGGAIATQLSGTRQLTLDAEAGFTVDVSNSLLTELNVTADFALATAAGDSRVSASSRDPQDLLSSSQTFLLSAVEGPTLSTSSSIGLGLDALPAWNIRYADRAETALPGELWINASHGAGGGLDVNFASDTSMRVQGPMDLLGLGSLLSPPGALKFETGGDISLVNVSTAGGSLTARSRNGDISIDAISTRGSSGAGDITLVSEQGSIVQQAGGAIDVGSFVGEALTGPSGTVTLDAANGSIHGTPLLSFDVSTMAEVADLTVSGAQHLSVRARDTIAVQAGGWALSSLSVEASAAGQGSISVGNVATGSLTIARGTDGVGGANELQVSGTAAQPLGFTLRSQDGGIRVTDNLGGFNNLNLDAAGGDLSIAASTNALAVSATGTVDLRAGNDIRIASGATAGASVLVSGAAVQADAGRDLRIEAIGDRAEVTSTSVAYRQTLTAGRDIVLQGGSAAGARATVATNFTTAGTGYQDLTAGRHIAIQGGSGANAQASLDVGNAYYQQSIVAGGDVTLTGGAGQASFARLSGAVTYQYLDIDGSVHLQGGAGQDSHASWTLSPTQSGYQSGRIGGDLVVQGGNAVNQGSGAYAMFAGGTQDLANIGGGVRVIGGTAQGTRAELSSRANQSLGVAYTGYGSATDHILVQGGSGDGAEAVLTATGNQSLYAGLGSLPAETGHIQVIGGAGQNARALVSAGGAQTVGSSSTTCYYGGCNVPTQDIRVQGGTGAGASASLRAVTSQALNAGGAVRVIGGGSTGATADITASGANSTQTIGRTDVSGQDATDLIEVRGGAGAAASITAGRNQTLLSSGDIVVAGGSGANASASIVSLNGAQVIGSSAVNGGFRDATDNIVIEGGTGTGAYAAITAFNGQTLEAGGAIALRGGAQGAYAEVNTQFGAQQVGRANYEGDYSFGYYTDATDSISLTGGAAGAHARFSTGGQQLFAANDAITLVGGSGAGATAQVVADNGQEIHSLGSLAVVGGTDTGTGSDATGFINRFYGEQVVRVGSNLSIKGGSGATDVGLLQQAVEAGQSISAGGDIEVAALSDTSGSVAIDSAGSQDITAGGALRVNNQAGQDVRIQASWGGQSVTASSLSVELAGSRAGAFSGLTTVNGADQSIRVVGDGATAGTATVTVRNTNTGADSRAAIASSGALELQATDDNYDSAGLVQVGATTDRGASEISAATDLTLVAGSLRIQGGATASAQAAVNATDNMSISTLYGATELVGGAEGSASIDPALLYIASNGSVLLQGGTGAGATSTITAGSFFLASTAGDLNLVNSIAAATINATSFSFFGPNTVNLTGGTITVADTGAITIDGVCLNCTTNLIGNFTVRSYVAPAPTPQPPGGPVVGGPAAPGTGSGPGTLPLFTFGDYVNQVANNLTSLTDFQGNSYELVTLEDGSVVVNRTRRNQCL